MPYDAGTAKIICAELDALLTGGRVEKITQPSKEEINFTIYSNRERYRLVFDLDANSPKAYVSAETRENNTNIPMFLTLLRKYLSNGRIVSFAQPEFDRIIETAFDSADDMGFIKRYYLTAELIRKQSNLILSDENKRIITLLRHVDFSLSQVRQVMPGMKYEPPVQVDKTDPFSITKDEFFTLADGAAEDLPVENFLLKNFRGFSTLLARETAYLTAKRTDCALGEADRERLWYHFVRILQVLKENTAEPCIIEDKEGMPLDFSFFPVRQYESAAVVRAVGNMSEAVERYFLKRERDRQLRQKAHDILKILSNAESKLNKKLRNQEKDLADCTGKDKYKMYGDLITANIYRLKRGDKTAEVENYYTDGEIISIPLEVNMTPSQNAQKYYKKYNKLKTAEIYLEKQMVEAKADLVYIDTIFDSLTRALSDRELSEIREELTESGLTAKKKKPELKAGKKPPKEPPLSKPAEFVSPNGFAVLCGKNNKQNDHLTFKTAAKSDLWFHAQKIAGSHCILSGAKAKGASTEQKTNNIFEPQTEDIEFAAEIAAEHSKGKNMPIIPVDYTAVKYVKKPGGAKPGFVIYDNYKTIIIRK